MIVCGDCIARALLHIGSKTRVICVARKRLANIVPVIQARRIRNSDRADFRMRPEFVVNEGEWRGSRGDVGRPEGDERGRSVGGVQPHKRIPGIMQGGVIIHWHSPFPVRPRKLVVAEAIEVPQQVVKDEYSCHLAKNRHREWQHHTELALGMRFQKRQLCSDLFADTPRPAYTPPAVAVTSKDGCVLQILKGQLQQVPLSCLQLPTCVACCGVVAYRWHRRLNRWQRFLKRRREQLADHAQRLHPFLVVLPDGVPQRRLNRWKRFLERFEE
mmetsp:Transcript_45795/g.97687  ORF Transcript_45795/g.97687 Transcript_45795/m.97687 type:complete len:272 (-) Transcript_45795:319-1134(-)